MLLINITIDRIPVGYSDLINITVDRIPVSYSDLIIEIDVTNKHYRRQNSR